MGRTSGGGGASRIVCVSKPVSSSISFASERGSVDTTSGVYSFGGGDLDGPAEGLIGAAIYRYGDVV